MTDTPRKIQKTEAEWQDQLTPEQYRITRMKGTERPFSGEYYDNKEEGVYRCVACGTPSSRRPPSTIPVRAGRASGSHSTKQTSRRKRIGASSCAALRYTAPSAAPTRDTSSRTGRPLRASATASTLPHSASTQKPNQSNFLASHNAPYRLVGASLCFLIHPASRPPLSLL